MEEYLTLHIVGLRHILSLQLHRYQECIAKLTTVYV